MFAQSRKANAPPRYARIDALRGIAILSVMVFHAWIIRPFDGPWWLRFIGQGAQGVGLFYMVSALTLSLSWSHRQRIDQEPAKAFWARRFFRIAPMFYLILGVVYLFGAGNTTVVPTAMRHHIFTWTNLIAHLTFVFGWLPWFQNSWIGVEWSIGVEMTFYFLFPMIMQRVFPRVGALVLLAAGLFSALAWPWFLQHLWFPWPHWAKSFLLWSFPEQAIWFAAGFAVVKQRNYPSIAGWATLWMISAIFLGGHVWQARTANILWVGPNFLLVWLTWHNYRGLRWLTANRLLQYVGTRSYSLYLVHWLVLREVTHLPLADTHTLSGWGMRLMLAVPISLMVAELSFRYVEKPGMALGKAWIRWRGWGQPQASTSTSRETSAEALTS